MTMRMRAVGLLLSLLAGSAFATSTADALVPHAMHLRDGRTVAMTADVPGAEARRAGLGIVMVARQSGRPILPVAIANHDRDIDPHQRADIAIGFAVAADHLRS